MNNFSNWLSIIFICSFVAHSECVELSNAESRRNVNLNLHDDDSLTKTFLDTQQADMSKALKAVYGTRRTDLHLSNISEESSDILNDSDAISKRQDRREYDPLSDSVLITILRALRDISRKIFYQTTIGRAVAVITIPLRSLGGVRRNIRGLYHHLRQIRRSIRPALMRKLRFKRYLFRFNSRKLRRLIKLLRRIQIRRLMSFLSTLRKYMKAILNLVTTPEETIKQPEYGWVWEGTSQSPDMIPHSTGWGTPVYQHDTYAASGWQNTPRPIYDSDTGTTSGQQSRYEENMGGAVYQMQDENQYEASKQV